ncbi:MAG: caspase family protein [Gemmataceae bacterium]
MFCRAAIVVATVAFATTSVSAQQTTRRFAVLVGVGDYDHPKLKPLAFAQQDAFDLAKLLETHQYKIDLLCDRAATERQDSKPTLANIRARLTAVLRECRKGDVVLVGFAGHGLQFSGEKDCYFCPSDAKPFPEERATLLSLQQLYRDLDRSNAGVKLLLVDACRDDPNGTRGVDADAAPRPPRGVAALFSCAAGQRAFEVKQYRHGVFFHHVIEGLKGKAKDADNDVTWHSLSGYVRKRVNKDVQALIGNGARQEPHGIDDLVGEPPVLVSFGTPRVVQRPATPGQAISARPPVRRVAAEQCMPDDTAIVIHVNARQMAGSPVLRPIVLEITNSLAADGPKSADLDLIKDTRTVYFAARNRKELSGALIFQGNYQVDTFRQAHADTSQYEPVTLPGTLAAYRQRATKFLAALLDQDMFVYAYGDDVLADVAAKRTGERVARYSPALQAVMGTINRSISVTVGFPDKAMWTTDAAERQLGGIKRVNAFRLSAHFDADLRIHAAAGLANPVDATALVGAVNGFLAGGRARSLATAPTDSAALAALLATVRVTTAGPTSSGVSIKGSLTREEIRPIIDDFLTGYRQGFAESRKRQAASQVPSR